MSHRVASIAQSNYEASSLAASIRRAVKLTDFDLAAVRNKRVLLKPNLLGAFPPALGVTTDPRFVAACVRLFQEAGAAEVALGDSPNGVHPLDLVWEVTEMDRVCRETGARAIRFESSGSTTRNEIAIARAVVETDFVINLPKFKTHSLTVMTLAVKNCFGCINGMQKAGLHRQHPKRDAFARMLVRVAEAVRPALTIVDGIIAMEGNGPSAGALVDLQRIVVGTNVHAVDAACCRLIGVDPMRIDTLAAAHTLGIWSEDDPIVIVGETTGAQPFRLPATVGSGARDWWLSRLVMKLIWLNFSAHPRIAPSRCRRCGLCVKACPVGAIAWPDEKEAPQIDKDKCVDCFCCHEVCPHRAIDIRRSLGIKLFDRLTAWRHRRPST